MRIVDTTVWIDYLRGVRNAHTDWLNANVSREPLGLTDLILFEILQGLPDQRSFARVFACPGALSAVSGLRHGRLRDGHSSGEELHRPSWPRLHIA